MAGIQRLGRLRAPPRLYLQGTAGVELRILPMGAASRSSDLAPPSGAPGAAVGPSKRVDGLDAVRALAALAIVWNHTAMVLDDGWVEHRARYVGLFGVPYFILTSSWLAGEALRTGRHTPWGLLVIRARRIAIPWCLWSLLFLGFEFLLAWVGGGAPRLDWQRLSYGGPIPYWFLPFLFLTSLYVTGAVAFARTSQLRRQVTVVASLGCAVALYCWPLRWIAEHPSYGTFERWERELALPLLGAVLAIAAPRELSRWNWPRWIPGAAVLLVLTCLAVLVGFGRQTVTIHLAGAAMLLLGWSWRLGTWGKCAAWVGRHGYSIYLLHVFPLELWYAWARSHAPSVAGVAAVTLAVYAGSLGAAVLLRKVRWLDWLRP